MLIQKHNLVTITLAAAVFISSAAFAQGNNLVQLDLKRSSDSSLDVTLVTSDTYNDNVMVRKKSDNKYVILVPKVTTSGYRASNIAGVHDLVMDVDVKTIEDTTGGYTKVTLITKKPLDIKTRTMKSMPLSAEMQEYNTLIAQANVIKNDIGKVNYKTLNNPKTEVTVDKTPKNIKSDVQKPKVNAQKPKIELEEITPEVVEKQKNKDLKGIKDIKADEKALEEYTAPIAEVPKASVSESNNIENIEDVHSDKNNLKDKVPSKLPKALAVSLGCFILLSALSRVFRKPDLQTANIKNEEIFTNNISDVAAGEKEYYDNLASNSELSWREKYKLYMDKSAQPVKRVNKKGYYSFIKTPSQIALDEKRANLEKMLSSDEFTNNSDYKTNSVSSEDNLIAQTMRLENTANKIASLNKTSRANSRFKRYEVEIPLHEQNLVKLEETPLSANRRDFKDANLDVADVDSRKIKFDSSNYIMSSVEEYFSILDKEKNSVAEQSEIKPAISETKPLPEPESQQKHMTSPVASVPKTDMANAVIKSKYKISDDKGIYLVNKNGKNSLVGKVNNKTFILKNFDGKVTDPIRVRHDNDNVYMVKAGDFKSLVEVNDDKMGVLIEL